MKTTWRGLGKGLLFCAGMLSSGAAGHLFYLGRYLSGGAMFLLTALFLFYAMADPASGGDGGEELSPAVGELRAISGRLALLAAENAINGAKFIGRTLPCSQQELSRLEDDLTALLDSLPVERKEKERIAQEFEKLRTRSRQTEARRVLTNHRLP
ncbi:MAG: hypothetical protein LBO82_09340 [Synergistaceae bacterium]|jgi:hypothetical protein|nr:hypothetical protein [Synergistaceae bacterium]